MMGKQREKLEDIGNGGWVAQLREQQAEAARLDAAIAANLRSWGMAGIEYTRQETNDAA